MFAATQHFLTVSFEFITVASIVGLALELAYFLATEAPAQPTPQSEPNEAPPAPPAPRQRPMVAPVVAKALTTETLGRIGVVQLRKLALGRGLKGAGRWNKTQLLGALA